MGRKWGALVLITVAAGLAGCGETKTIPVPNPPRSNSRR